MGFTAGIVKGASFRMAVMFGWSYVMRYRRTKRIAKGEFDEEYSD